MNCKTFITLTTKIMGGKDWCRLIGLQRLGPKGQIVIPKEARDSLGLEPGAELYILIKGCNSIGLVKSDELDIFLETVRKTHEKLKKQEVFMKILGLTQLGTKGQIVIPKDARTALGIESGTDVACILTKTNEFGVIGIIRNNDLQDFFDHIESVTRDLEKIIKN